MARNPVQFQKGISLNAFLSLYGTEDQCFDALYLAPMGLCALTVAMTVAANSTAASSNSAIAATARPRLPQAPSSTPPSCP